jgi:DNA-binding SARP family transcriptional activator
MVDFGIMGAVRVRGSDGVPQAIPAPRHRTLLAALLLSARRAVSVDALAEYVWDANPPKNARATLQTYVMRLRRRLGPDAGNRIKTSPPGYLIDVREELDLYQFEELRNAGVSAASAGAWERAAAAFRPARALWRGEPLADVTSDTLIRAECARLSESRLLVTERWAEAELRLGRAHDILSELSRLADADPYREALQAHLITALYQEGRKADALTVFRNARQRLIDEFGVEPGRQLRAAHAMILADEHDLMPATLTGGALVRPGRSDLPGLPGQPDLPDLPAVSGRQALPRQLPADIPDFTGRDDDVERMTELLSAADDDSRTARLVAISGCGGIGKTALAVHGAHMVSGHFPDGQLYVNLLGATTRPAATGSVLAAFLRALGVADAAIPACDDEKGAAYRTALASRRVLIVLDDARDAAQVRPLLPGAGSSSVIVTSRRRLAGLSGARMFALDVLSGSAAMRLFARIVGTKRVRAEPGATDGLVELCGGLPLAIRIAAARLAANPGWMIAAFRQRLVSSGDDTALDEFTAGDLALRSCFDLSYQSLPRDPDGAARTFRLLGLAGIPVFGPVAVAALTSEPEGAAAAALDALADVRLVECPAPDKYRLHDLIRLYAAERAADEEPPGERNAAMRRLLEWYLRMADGAARAIDPFRRWPPGSSAEAAGAFGTAQAALEWCDSEWPNVAAAIERAASLGMHDIASRLALALWVFYVRRPDAADWLRSHETALVSARKLGDEETENLLLDSLGQAY